MKTSQNGLEFIKKEEGCKLTAYKLKNEKYYTIGVGHYGPDVKAGQTITMAQALSMLSNDLVSREKAVNNINWKFPLTQNMFDVLVSYAYNRGTGKLKEICSYETPDECAKGIIIHWGSATTYKDALIARRKREAALFLKGYTGSVSIVDSSKSIEQIANEVIDGKWGNGDSRVERIEAAGYDYKMVQMMVNAKLGKKETSVEYFPKYNGDSVSISDIIKGYGYDSSKASRKKIADANAIKDYTGTYAQNLTMLRLVKDGKLIKA